MTLFHKRLEVAFLIGIGSAFAALASPATQATKTEDKNAEKAEAATPITVDFKITVDGVDANPAASNIEIKGLNDCRASPVGTMNAQGQGRFKSLPSCIVELKIFISGLSARIAQVDVSKYKGPPVRIEITTSSQQVKVTFPGPPPPAVSPTR
jgi:hypothetical protein